MVRLLCCHWLEQLRNHAAASTCRSPLGRLVGDPRRPPQLFDQDRLCLPQLQRVRHVPIHLERILNRQPPRLRPRWLC